MVLERQDTMLLPRVRAIVAAAGAAVGLFAGVGYGQTATHWANPVSDLWSNNAAWDFGAPVSPAFDAFISVAGSYTVTLDQDFSVHNVTLDSAGATLALTTHNLNLTGNYSQNNANVLLGTITAGTVTIGGTTTLGDTTLMHVPNFMCNGPLTFNGAVQCEVCDTGVGLGGPCQWTGAGNILMDEGATLSNPAGSTFTDQGAGAHMLFWDNTGTQPTFTNAGTFTKAAGTGTTSIAGVMVNNTGMVRVDAGTLSADTVAQVSGTTLTGGHWMVTGGSTLNLTSALTTNAGDVTLQGAGSTFTSISGLSTNAAGGTLTLNSGATFSAGGFTNNGVLAVNGAGSSFSATGLTNSSGGNLTGGTYNASGGATMQLTGVNVTTLNASVTLSGAASDLLNGGVSILRDFNAIGPSGTFSIQNGHNFTTSAAAANFAVASTGNLTVGAGTAFNLAHGFIVNNFAGGVLNFGGFHIAGTLAFDGAAITRVNTGLDLDGPGVHIINQLTQQDATLALSTVQSQGNLNILNGHQLTLTAANVPLFTLTGRLGIAGSGLDTASELQVAADFTQDPSGILDLDGGILSVGQMLTLNGTVMGNGTIQNGNSQMNGRMSPGHNGAGTLIFTHQLTVGTAAVYQAELGGTDPGTFDQVVVNDLLTFLTGRAGTLEVSLLPGFTPSVGQRFDVMLYGSRGGEFASYSGLDLGNGLSLDVEYLSDRLELVVVPAPAGVLALLPFAAAIGVRRRRA